MTALLNNVPQPYRNKLIGFLEAKVNMEEALDRIE